jgi:hypothetical protein
MDFATRLALFRSLMFGDTKNEPANEGVSQPVAEAEPEQEPIAVTPEPEVAEDVSEEQDPVLTAPPPQTEIVPEPVAEDPVAEPEQEPIVVTPEPEVAEDVSEEQAPVSRLALFNRLMFGDTKNEPANEGVSQPVAEAEPEQEPIAVTPEPEVVEEVSEEQDPVLTAPPPQTEIVPEPVAEDPVAEPAEEENVVTGPILPQPVAGDPSEEQPETEVDAPPPEPVAAVIRQVAPTALDSSGPLTVSGGRVTTFSLPEAEDIVGVTVTSMSEHGNVTVNPDFTLALVLSGNSYSGPLSFNYSVTHTDGTITNHTADLSITAPTQEAGWGLGDHYMLATDENDRVIVEHGDIHRKVYISESAEALSRADIAALEGVSEATITNSWLLANPQYGGSEALPLNTEVGGDVWIELTWNKTSSHWLLFERGYAYDLDGWKPITYGPDGESPLHPMHITSWGVGDRPFVTTDLNAFQTAVENVVVTDIEFSGGFFTTDGAKNILVDGAKFNGASQFKNTDAITVRYSEYSHITYDAPKVGDTWSNADQITTILSGPSNSLLLENNFFHHTGWVEGYDFTLEAGMAPNSFSHNVYLAETALDVTFRDNIVSQGSSFGLHLRGGGYAEGNLFLDNNIAVDWFGGNFREGQGPQGNYTLFADNVVTSAGHKAGGGAVDWGIRNVGIDTTLIGNLAVHEADPDDAAEMAFKSQGGNNPLLNFLDPFFDDTIVYNWNGFEKNTSGLDPLVMNQTTIQDFAIDFLNIAPGSEPPNIDYTTHYKSGLLDALMDYADANWQDGTLTAEDIIDWFQAGFGFDLRSESATYHRFIPNDLGDGVRWDNRLNWSSDERPDDGDTVDLGGNWVNYSGTTMLDALDLGSGGKLQVGQGKLTVETLETGHNGGMLLIERAGQFWTSGYAGDAILSIEVTGGRFANSGEVNGRFTMSVEEGQTILGVDDARFVIGEESELRIEGSAARVGFDGAENGISTLHLHDDGNLSFVASASGLATLQEFRSGAWDQEGTSVRSGAALNGTLTVDLSAFDGTGTLKLIEVDAIAGLFEAVSLHGLGTNRDAELIIDYAADLVMLQLSAGSGQSSLSIIGDALDGSDEDTMLWEELTSGMSFIPPSDTPILHLDEAIDPLHEMSFL